MPRFEDARQATSGGDARWLSVCRQGLNLVLGVALVAGGVRLSLSGATVWCPFDGMPTTVARVVGGGMVVCGTLLFVKKTAVVGLGLAMVWVLFWAWGFAGTLWGNHSCPESALAIGVLFSTMGVTGIADRRRETQADRKLMLFAAAVYLLGSVVLWVLRRWQRF